MPLHHSTLRMLFRVLGGFLIQQRCQEMAVLLILFVFAEDTFGTYVTCSKTP
jgi:methyl coenzyme M reductase subunit C-like uncharacterized protein (methanogenesis marker protein 7)